jgi:hypothetical protein
MTRSSLSVESGVADDFSLQAERSGKTLYAFANEWLDAASKISAQGGNAKEIVGYWQILAVLKQVDIITLPADFVEDLISSVYQKEKEHLFKTFSDLGANLVGLMKMVAPDMEKLAELAREFAVVIPTKRIEILRPDGNAIQVNIIGAGRRIETTECSFEFVKSIVLGYGYNITSQEIGVGVIRIRATKRSG